MSTIGNFNALNPNDELAELSGHINTMEFEASIKIRRDDPSNNPDAPTHSVSARAPSGSYVQVGSAWTKQIVNGPNSGGEFLSVTLDDPSFEHPLNFAVFREGNRQWNAVWRRRQAGAA